MISVFEQSWLRGLFGDEEAAALWSPETQLGHILAFEVALARALEAAALVPEGLGGAAARHIERAEVDIESLAHRTAIDGLPVPDLVRQLRAAAGDASAAIHTGATSQDVMDTALALTLRDLSDVLIARLRLLDAALRDLDEAHGATRLMGRTRMQAALPIIAGDRIEAWRRAIAHHAEALDDLRPLVERLQLGGAVGTAHAFGDKADAIASHLADDLRLHPGPVWHTDRAGPVDYAGRLSAITGSLGKIGQDIALMAQQGVDEISVRGGGGSSAMPHKSNPVLAELLVTLARFNATQIAGMHHALIHEQERSGAAWMLEWMVLPSMTMATARALAAARELIEMIDRMGSPEMGSVAQIL